jgi:hypothetical protein
MNAADDALDFTLPTNLAWRLVFDSAAPEREAGAIAGPLCRVEGHACVMVAAVMEAPP